MSDADLTLTYSLKPESGAIDDVKKVVKRLSNLDKSWDSMNVMERAASVLEELNSGWGDIAKRAAESSLKEAKKAKSIGMRSFNKGKAHRVVIADDSQLLLGAGSNYGALSVDVNSTWKTIHEGMVKAAKYRPLKPITDPFEISDSRGVIAGGRRFSIKKSGEFQWDDEGIWHDVSAFLPHQGDVFAEVRDYLWSKYPTIGHKEKMGPTKRNTPYTNYRPDWQFLTDERRDALIPLNTAVPMDIGYTPNWNRYEGLNNGALVRSAIGAILNYAYVPDWQSKFGIDEVTAVGKFRGDQDADFKSLGYEFVKDKPSSSKKKKSLFTTAKDFLKDKMPDVLGNIKDSVIGFAKELPMRVLKTIGRLVVSELLHITTMSFDITKKLFFMPAKTLVNGLHNILKSAASQSQIIQSIMQLTIIPFVLMFEYLLLPVVKAIIPIITNMVKIIASNKDSIMKWGEVLADFITKVASPVLSMFDGKFFSNPISGVFDIMTGMMNGAAEWIRNNSVELSNVLLSTIESAGKFLASNAEVAATLAISIADSISNYLRSDNFKEIYPTIKDAFVTILQCVRQVLTDPAIVTLMKDLVWQFATTLVDVAIDILRGGNSYSESLNAIDKYGLDYSALKDPEFKKLVEDYNNKMSWYDNLLFDFERNGQDKMYNEKYGMGYKDYYNNKYDSDMNLYYITHNYGSSSTDTFGKDGAISY